MKLIQYVWKSFILKIINAKMLVFAIFIGITCWSYNRPMRELTAVTEYPVSWCIFPFLMCSFAFLLLFWLCIVYINTDIPFMQHLNMYQLIRTGRIRWGIGQICGIFLRSFVAVVYTAVCSILTLGTRIEFTNDWGKLLRTIAMTNAGEQFNLTYPVYYEIFSEFTPVQLMAIVIIICTLIATLLALLMFAVCLYINRIASVAIGTAWIVLLFFVLNTNRLLRYKIAKVVPVIWTEVARIATAELGYYWLPSIPYMLVFLLAGIAILSIAILWKTRTMEFYWEDEDI